MNKVAIIDGGFKYHMLFLDKGFEVFDLNNVDQVSMFDFSTVDTILFTGGADIDPNFYGHDKHPKTGTSRMADELCIFTYAQAKIQNPDIRMVGICRGSQFLCAMSGGELIQHCDNHAVGSGHEVNTIFGETFHVTSTHHQMQYPEKLPNEDYVVLAHTRRAEVHQQCINGSVVAIEPDVDYEVVHYRQTNALAFQPHPEYDEETAELFWKCYQLAFVDSKTYEHYW
ncbi:class I glutamine amidotransferase-like protein [Vibrio phage 1.262.O._10N.286.51.A9]|nr:class I glutamine amidotransferase-like protein [Vibrio phage 1.262.O._10N.286.51.A9]